MSHMELDIMYSVHQARYMGFVAHSAVAIYQLFPFQLHRHHKLTSCIGSMACRISRSAAFSCSNAALCMKNAAAFVSYQTFAKPKYLRALTIGMEAQLSGNPQLQM